MSSEIPNQPICAVLLAACNGEKWIDEQITSILQQKGVDVKIFISIDLSTDSTLEKVQYWSNKDNRVIILPFGESYGNAAKNFYRLIKDVDINGFDIIAFSDQDDIWKSDKLHRAWSKISCKICDVYSSDVIAFWENGKESLIKKSYPQKKYDHFFEAAGPGCTYVFSSRSFLAVKEFIKDNYSASLQINSHDWLIYAYCRSINLEWLIDNKPKMLYRQHDNNQVGTNNNVSAYIKRLRIVNKKQYRKKVTSIYNLVMKNSIELDLGGSFILRNIFEVRRRPRDQIALFLFVIMRLF